LGAAAALAAGVALLIGKVAGYEHVLHAVKGARPEWLAVALPGEVLAYVGYTLVLRRAAALRGGPLLSGMIGARLVLISLAATRLVVVGGPALLYWGLRHARLSKRGAIARLVALNVLLYVVFMAAGALAAIVVLISDQGRAARALAVTWLLAAAALVTALSLAGGAARLSTRVRRLLELAGALLGRRERASAISGAGLFWLGDILCLWASLRASDVRVGAAALVLAYASSYVLTMLPVLLGGVGGPEAALALALHAFGIALAPALLGVLAYRVISFWLPTIPGLALLPTIPQLGDQLQQTSKQRP
jgi:glycosyltransferase 2 family protein